MNNFFRRGGLWVLGQGALMLTVVVAGVLWHNERSSLVLTVGAMILLLTAAVCGIFGSVGLGRSLTPFPRPSSGTRLVQSGIYSLIRHPLYTAVMCGSIGWAFFQASWPALLAALALVPFFDAKARREERWLRRQFPEYSKYEQRVRRFIPGVY